MKVRQALPCKAKRTSDGQPCGRYAMMGQQVCATHGGSSPQARAKAAERLALAKAEGLLSKYGIDEPITDPLGALLDVAGRFNRLAKALEEKVNKLKEVRYSTAKAGEQLRAEIGAYTTVLDRLRATLTDIGRLDIEARMVRIEEAKTAALLGVLNDGVKAAGLSEAQEFRLRQAVAAGLRRLDAP